jgi:hypothetical protein
MIQHLHHLFWTCLPPEDRIKILVQLGLLPKIPDQPLPHAVEVMALHKATSKNKLYSLWEIVMPLIPEIKRKPNPFEVS